jgi:hypothetical protein
MFAKWMLCVVGSLLVVSLIVVDRVWGQAAPASPAWRTANGTASVAGGAGALARDEQPPLKPVTSVAKTPVARVTKGPGALPNDAGQEWRDYDISPYTARVTSTARPEQAILDWIFFETGYEAWHSEPLSILSANRRTLRVYHTPQMQAVVGEMVDRFVNSEAETQAFGVRVVSVGSPTWRVKAHKSLKAVGAQSQGVQAWLLAKEDASLLAAELRKRSDYREHSTPHLLVNNGQSTVIAVTRPRNYVRDVVLTASWPGFEPQTAQLDEGFSLQFHPLMSLDAKTIDAVIKCNVDQVERMIPVNLDVPTPVAPRQRTKIDVPQIASCRLHERFRWPTDQVLLISLGVVAAPVPTTGPNPLMLLPGTSATRADLLVFVESKGKAAVPATAQRPGQTDPNSYKGRY